MFNCRLHDCTTCWPTKEFVWYWTRFYKFHTLQFSCSSFSLTKLEAQINKTNHVLAAYLCLLKLVTFVLGVLLLQSLHGQNNLFQGFVGLLGVIDDKAGVLLLFGPVVHGLTATGLCRGKTGSGVRGRTKRSNENKHGKYAGVHVHALKHSRLTLHLDQFGHVRVEQGINPLSLSVSIHVQLDVCWEATENTCMQDNERVEKEQ